MEWYASLIYKKSSYVANKYRKHSWDNDFLMVQSKYISSYINKEEMAMTNE